MTEKEHWTNCTQVGRGTLKDMEKEIMLIDAAKDQFSYAATPFPLMGSDGSILTDRKREEWALYEWVIYYKKAPAKIKPRTTTVEKPIQI